MIQIILIWCMIGFISSLFIVDSIRKLSNFKFFHTDFYKYSFALIACPIGIFYLQYYFYSKERKEMFVRAIDRAMIWNDMSLADEYRKKYSLFYKLFKK